MELHVSEGLAQNTSPQWPSPRRRRIRPKHSTTLLV